MVYRKIHFRQIIVSPRNRWRHFRMFGAPYLKNWTFWNHGCYSKSVANQISYLTVYKMLYFWGNNLAPRNWWRHFRMFGAPYLENWTFWDHGCYSKSVPNQISYLTVYKMLYFWERNFAPRNWWRHLWMFDTLYIKNR